VVHFASRSRKSAVDWHELRRRETVGRGHVRKSMMDRHRKETEPLTGRRTEETTSRTRRDENPSPMLINAAVHRFNTIDGCVPSKYRCCELHANLYLNRIKLVLSLNKKLKSTFDKYTRSVFT